MLQHTNIWLLVIAIISILFFFFGMRVRFAKHPSLKSYALFFYAFIFYSISAISFVILNAMNSFFKIDDGLYSEIVWFFPINFLAAFIGYLCAWLIHFAASKVAAPYTYKLLNSSLVIIVFALILTLLVQPMQITFERVLSYHAPAPKPKEINVKQITLVPMDTLISQAVAMPAELYDSLVIRYQNQKINFVNPTNGFSFHVPVLINPVEQLYVLPLPNFKYLAVLALSPRIQEQSELLLVDSMGTCIFKQSYPHYYNQLASNFKGNALQINTLNLADSVELGLTYTLK